MSTLKISIFALLMVGLVASSTHPLSAHAAPTSTAGESQVEIVHPVDARLFGLIDTTLPLSTRMQSDGSFSLNYPWYSFMFSTNRAQLETKLQAVGKAVDEWHTTTFSLDQQITLLGLLRAALESTSTQLQ